MELVRDDIGVSSWLSAKRATNSAQVAAMTFVLYDHLVSLDLEVEHIWRQNWTYSKLLYMLCRYLSDLVLILEVIVFMYHNPSHNFCTWGVLSVAFGMCAGLFVTQAILQTRLRALYPPNSRIVRFVFAAFVVEMFFMLAMFIVAVMTTELFEELGNYQSFCMSHNVPSYTFAVWIPVLSFETLLFIMAFRATYGDWKQFINVVDWKRRSLLEVLLRDSFIYFLIAFMSYLITLVGWLTCDSRYFPAIAALTYAVNTVTGCRLVLNLSQAYHEIIHFTGGSDVGLEPDFLCWGLVTGTHALHELPTHARSVGIQATLADANSDITHSRVTHRRVRANTNHDSDELARISLYFASTPNCSEHLRTAKL